LTDIITHSMGDGIISPCGLHPMMVYRGLQAGFTTDWSEVDCAECLGKKPGVEPPTPHLKSFFVTFGVGYAYTEHPYWMGAHSEGYLEVVAPDEEQARALVRTYIGLKWSHMYDRRPEWAKRGCLAIVSTDGSSWSASGVAHPTPRFGTSDPEYYGHDSTELVAARIEGELLENSDQDALDNLGYEAELVHRGCLNEGLAMFKEVTEVDSRVQAGELDWAEPYSCAVCEQSIT
jgi:hypothetical protein